MGEAGKPRIEQRIKDLLDETRLVMLGTQLLLGLQFRVAFSARFAQLPPAFRWADGIALLLILAASAFLLATPAYHQLSEHGHATTAMINTASRNLRHAMLPIGLGLGIDAAIGMRSTLGTVAAIAGGLAFALASIVLWYVLPLVAARRRGQEDEAVEEKTQSLETRIEQALTEIRVILPGVQALFGFQFSAVLTQAFGKLGLADRCVHLGSMGAVAVAILLLIAPVSYHRIAAKGAAEPGVLRYCVGVMLVALGLLALGITGDSYVTTHLISGMTWLAIAVGLVAAAGFAAMIYGVPLAARARRHATARA